MSNIIYLMSVIFDISTNRTALTASPAARNRLGLFDVFGCYGLLAASIQWYRPTGDPQAISDTPCHSFRVDERIVQVDNDAHIFAVIMVEVHIGSQVAMTTRMPGPLAVEAQIYAQSVGI